MGSSSRSTFASVIEKAAERDPDRQAIVYLGDDLQPRQTLTYGELRQRASRFAAELGSVAARGERVLIVQEFGCDFVVSFFACLWAGLIAVPAYVPVAPGHRERLRLINQHARPAAAVISGDGGPLAECLPGTVLVDERKADPGRKPLPRQDVSPEGVAFLQYTSGSIGNPRGVRVTHRSLLDNQEAIRRSFGHDGETVVGGWLPLNHDMGLVGNLLQTIYLGVTGYFLTPAQFIRKPERWLRLVSQYGVTTSGGPNFSYQLCVDRVREEAVSRLTLDSWRVAFNGSEPVKAETLRAFAAKFGRSGFSGRALFPCYGLAENTLLVSGGHWAGGGPVAYTSRNGRSLEREVVSCGRPEYGVTILDESGVGAAESFEGEICVQGGAVADGYWEDAAKSGVAFREEPGGKSLRTGDLGFVRGGELFVTGRLKDVLIVGGENFHASEIEIAAQEAHGDLAGMTCVAFQRESVPGDGVDLVVEGAMRPEAWPEILGALISSMARLGVPLRSAHAYRRGALPRTANGKLRRFAVAEALFGNPPCPPTHAWKKRDGVEPLDEKGASPSDLIKAYWRESRDIADEPIEDDADVAGLGLDSVELYELSHVLGERFGVPLTGDRLLRGVTLAELDALAAGGQWHPHPEAESPREVEGSHPLSGSQRSLVWLHLADSSRVACNLAFGIRFAGRSLPSTGRLRKALDQLVEAHPSLRSSIFFEGNSEGQHVAAGRAGTGTVSRLPQVFSERETLFRALTCQPFTGEADESLARFHILEGEDERIVFAVMHHSIVDLWSAEVLVEDLLELLEAEDEAPFKSIRRQGQAAFLAWKKRISAGAEGGGGSNGNGDSFRLRLPYKEGRGDAARPAEERRAGRNFVSLGARETADLECFCRQHHVTLQVALAAGVSVLLRLCTGAPRVPVTILKANRQVPALRRCVGYLASPGEIQSEFGSGTTFVDVVKQGRRESLRTQAEADFAGNGGGRLGQVVFSYQLERAAKKRIGSGVLFREETAFSREAPVSFFGFLPPLTQAEIVIRATKIEKGIGILVEFDRTLFDEATGGRLASELTYLLRILPAQSRAPVDALLRSGNEFARPAAPALGPARLSRPAADPDALGLFEENCRQMPDRIALVWKGPSAADDIAQISFGRLNRIAEGVAAALREAGVRAGEFVGIHCAPGIDHVAALLGILKLGAAYVPMDAAGPGNQARYILEGCGCRHVVVSAGGEKFFGERVQAVEVLPHWSPVSDPPAPFARFPGRPAYVIHTSGSSGRPKGVAIPMENLSRLVAIGQREFEWSSDDVFCVFHSFSFDFSVWEIWTALCAAGRLVIVSRDAARDPEMFLDLMERERISVLNQTPAAFFQLSQERERRSADFSAPRVLIFGGELLAFDRLRRDVPWLQKVEIVANMYGITETTVHVTLARIEPAGLLQDRASKIGLPLQGWTIHLLNRDLEKVAPGETAEIYVGGCALASGYVRQPRLTAERFLPDPLATEPGARMYRSGDLARQRMDQTFEALGRADDQIKLHGYRIEPAGIAAQLREHPLIDECHLRLEKEDELVAYVVPAEGTTAFSPRKVIAHARRSLPFYMVPKRVIFLESLPLTANGKVDGRRLAEARSEIPPDEGITTWEGSEKILAEAWEDVVGAPCRDREEDFFLAGGDSIRAVRFSVELRNRGVTISVGNLYRHRTIGGLSRHLRGEAGGLPAVSSAAPVRGVPARYPLSALQQGMVYQSELDPESFEAYVSHLEVEGALDEPRLARALQRVVERHPMLRTAYDLLAAEGTPRQVVHDFVPASLGICDWTGIAPDDRRRALDAFQTAARKTRWKWDVPPLFRIYGHRLDASRFALTLVESILDGWSVATFYSDLLSAYADDRPVAGAIDAGAYADFVAMEQRDWHSEERISFWKNYLFEKETFHLGEERRDFHQTTESVTRMTAEFSAEVLRAIEDRARAWRVPLKSVLLAAHAAVMGRLRGKPSVLTGLLCHTRPECAGAHRALGLFLNVVPIRLRTEGGWKQRGQAAWDEEMRITPHRGYPFAAILKLAEGRPPFDVLFNYTNFHVLDETLERLPLKLSAAFASDQTHFPLTIQAHVLTGERGLLLGFDYQPAAFANSQMASINTLYQEVIHELCRS